MPTIKPKRKIIKVHTSKPELMKQVNNQVENHYRGKLVESLRANENKLKINNITIHLAQEFGFCYGVRRAIDLAYAAYYDNPGKKIYLIGEIIHNPEVNKQLSVMGIQTISVDANNDIYKKLTNKDVVIVPAFGSNLEIMAKLQKSKCTIVDTTCGDVMTVWRRVKNNARKGYTSIIHGKANHEETMATASRAVYKEMGQYLVILSISECEYICKYIENGGDKKEFLKKFAGSYSEGFDPDTHLNKIGVANQTTMLKSETETIQKMLSNSLEKKFGENIGKNNFQYFDTICGATQERQDALVDLLKIKLDILIVVGGYNSSNTAHLVEIGELKYPTFFIRNKNCIKSLEKILHYDLKEKKEKSSEFPLKNKLKNAERINLGITAGASCPDNLIEETILKITELNKVLQSNR